MAVAKFISAGVYHRMEYHSLIGKRYIRSKKKRSISIINIIAIFGVFLGVAALSVVISISTGFQQEFIKKVLGVNAHVLVMKYGMDFREYRDVIKMMNDMPEIKGAAPFVIQPMMVSKGDRTASILLKGIDPELLTEVLDLPSQITSGTMEGLRVAGSVPPNFKAKPPSLSEQVDDLVKKKAGPKGVVRTLKEKGKDSEVLSSPKVETRSESGEDGGDLKHDPQNGEVEAEKADKVIHGSDLKDFEKNSTDGGTTNLVSKGGPIASDAGVQRGTEFAVADSNEPGELPGIIIGRTLAENIGAKVGDTLNITSPTIGVDMIGWSPSDNTPRTNHFKVIGIFYAGFLEYDTKLVYVDLYQAQRFFNQGDSVTGVEATVHDINTAKTVASRAKAQLGGAPYHTVDWERLNESLFTALQMQKVVLSLILAVVVGLAAFNIIATLVMMVFDKRREIAILQAMGATDMGILRIFHHVGTVVGIWGIAIGLVVGGGICLALDKIQWSLDPKVYLIDHLPVSLDWMIFVITAIVAFLVCQLAVIMPGYTAFGYNPIGNESLTKTPSASILKVIRTFGTIYLVIGVCLLLTGTIGLLAVLGKPFAVFIVAMLFSSNLSVALTGGSADYAAFIILILLGLTGVFVGIGLFFRRQWPLVIIWMGGILSMLVSICGVLLGCLIVGALALGFDANFVQLPFETTILNGLLLSGVSLVVLVILMVPIRMLCFERRRYFVKPLREKKQPKPEQRMVAPKTA